jgi:hypothetical protein
MALCDLPDAYACGRREARRLHCLAIFVTQSGRRALVLAWPAGVRPQRRRLLETRR